MFRNIKHWGSVISSLLAVALPIGMVNAASENVLVSKEDPIANCTVGGPGTVYNNAEVEPWADVNPTNPQNMVGVWQQDRWSNGGAHALVAGYSFDGGKTWGEVALPFSKCVPGGINYERASDPWVSFGPDGTLYSISISFNQSNNDNAVAAATSQDGGKTWQNVNILKADQTYQYFNDKESITADPVKAGVAYAVWDRLESPTNNPYAVAHSYAYTGPTWFAKTTDGGKTWSKAKIIVNTGQNNQTIGNQIVVDPRTGTLYDFFDYIVSTGPNNEDQHGYNVAFIKSTDGGETWTEPHIINSMNVVNVTDPNTGAPLRTGDIIPEPAIDPQTGNLYVVWQDGRFSNGQHADIAISSSTDGGQTWSKPVRVNTPSKGAFNPSVRINSHGVVGVTYYDFRDLTNETASLPTDYWLATSTDGGKTFIHESQLSGPFDMMSAPVAEGYFIGDYQGLFTVGDAFYPFFIKANDGDKQNPTDVYTLNISP